MQNIQNIIKQFKIPIKQILIEDGLMERASSLVDGLGFSNGKLLLVTDQNLDSKFASKITEQFNQHSPGRLKKLVLTNPKPDEKIVEQIISAKNSSNLIIALGSGTINDLCKLASFRSRIPYIIFGTATSMNGYASANASIISGGRKNSLPAQLPKAIYLDLTALCSAPERLIKAGIGDSLCFSTCQFDWLLSHLLLNSYYKSTPFELLKPYHQKLFDYHGNLKEKDFIELLAKILIISGLGMYISGGSYPASQAEHLIAHYLEIKYPQITEQSHHGEQIAITTLTIAKIQEEILQVKNLQLKPSKIDKNHLKNLFNKDLAEHFLKEINKKTINETRRKEINQNLSKNWQKMQKKLGEVLILENNLRKISQKFELCLAPKEIGIDDHIYQEATTNAYLIRNRFTSLDLKQNLE